MNPEKHREALAEVYRNIDDILNDRKGLLVNQRRIGLMSSLGMQQLIELYLHNIGILKPGSQIKHEIFAKDDRNIRLKISSVILKNISSIPRINEILVIANQIESNRNDIVYGAPLNSDEKLREKMDYFLELKQIIEKESGKHEK